MKKIRLLLFSLIACNSFAATYVVSTAPTAGQYATIKEAIAAAVLAADADPLISVEAGTYTENLIDIKTSMRIEGAGMNSTIIQGAATALKGVQTTACPQATVFSIMDGANNLNINVTLSNMTVQHGTTSNGGTYDGGGIRISKITGVGAKVTLNNLLVKDNYTYAKNGSGVAITGSNVEITNCIIRNNLIAAAGDAGTAAGAGIYIIGVSGLNTNVVMNNCLVSENAIVRGTAGVGGGVRIQSATVSGVTTATMNNCTFYKNSSLVRASGLCLYSAAANSLVVNMNYCTVAENFIANTTYTSGTGVMGLLAEMAATSTPTIAINNSISIGNYNAKESETASSTTSNQFYCPTGSTTATNFYTKTDAPYNVANCTKNGTYGAMLFASSLSTDPIPVLNVLEGSVAINYCALDVAGLPTHDTNGTLRPAIGGGKAPTAGAYEFHATSTAHALDGETTGISLLQNPVGEWLFFTQEVEQVEVFALSGQKLFRFGAGEQFDVASLNQGLYVAKTTKGGLAQSIPFVKK